MKSRSICLLLAMMAFAIQSTHAALVIYKGSGSSSSGTATGTAKETQTMYFIYDTGSAEGRLIFVSNKNHTIVDNGQRFYGFARTKSGTKFYDFLVADDESYTTNVNFHAYQVYLKGFETNLFLLTTTTGPFSFPKTLTGLLTAIDLAPTGTTVGFSFSYDAKLSQTDNTAGQSSLQASQNLRATYTAKGYTDTNPGVN